MTSDTTTSLHSARMQADLRQAVASLRCVREIMVMNEGVSSLPEHARILLEGVLGGLEGYAEAEPE